MSSEEANEGGDSPNLPVDVEDKIIQQIEYYFGDINLGRDKFLQQKMSEDNGWIEVEVLLKFNRLKALTTNNDAVVKALRKSTSSLLEIDECGKKIRRNVNKPLPEQTGEYKMTLNARSVYVKGFPLDASLDEITAFCREYGNVESVEMRKNVKTKQFKGSIFVVFDCKESAVNMINVDDVKFKDKALLRERKYE